MPPNFMFGGLRGKCCPIFCLMVCRGNAAQFSVWWLKGQMLPNLLCDGLRGKYCPIFCWWFEVAMLPIFSVWWCKGQILPNFQFEVSEGILPNFLFDVLQAEMLPDAGEMLPSRVRFSRGELWTADTIVKPVHIKNMSGSHTRMKMKRMKMKRVKMKMKTRMRTKRMKMKRCHADTNV